MACHPSEEVQLKSCFEPVSESCLCRSLRVATSFGRTAKRNSIAYPRPQSIEPILAITIVGRKEIGIPKSDDSGVEPGEAGPESLQLAI